MLCPNCNKPLVIPGRVEHNVSAYGKSLVGTTECCGTFVRMSRRIIIDVVPCTDPGRTEDDWGVPGKLPK